MFGFEISRTTEPKVRFGNFQNLCWAYEERLREGGPILESNELRATLMARLLGTPPSEAYFLVLALAKTREMSGDVCEFGVAQGETSALIANEIRGGSSLLHLFDSFEGLPKPTQKDQLRDDIFALGSMEAYAGLMSCPEEMVQARLNAVAFPSNRVVIHKGFVEKTIELGRDLPNAVRFAYIDFDFYEPIKRTLMYLHSVTSPGAVIIVDDYDYFSTGAKTATDEFVKEIASIDGEYEVVVPAKAYGHFAVLTRKK